MKKLGKSVITTIAIPVGVYIIAKILCIIFGDPSYATGSDLNTIIYNAIYTAMIALAMSYNLANGRFDFSIGAILVLTMIVGGNIAKEMVLGPAGFLIVLVVLGMAFGAISGLLYVILKLPPIITSLGCAMFFEAMGLLYNDSRGVTLLGKSRQMLIYSTPVVMIIVLIVVAIISSIIFEGTRFGYNHKALAAGQKIAVDLGINEKRNAVICYILSGALIGIAACMYLSKYGNVLPDAGLSSNTYFMCAFLPIFVGGVAGKYSNSTIGVIAGAFTSALLTSAFVKLGLSSSLQTVMNGVCVMGFLIYTSNSYKFVLKKLYKLKMKKAASSPNYVAD